jgi:ABC-type multidrug transport system ATPase subunit
LAQQPDLLLLDEPSAFLDAISCVTLTDPPRGQLALDVVVPATSHTDECDAALLDAAVTPLKGRLIAEPYFEGTLYSAETITWQGQTRLPAVLSRVPSPEPARREEASSFPVAFPEADR